MAFWPDAKVRTSLTAHLRVNGKAESDITGGMFSCRTPSESPLEPRPHITALRPVSDTRDRRTVLAPFGFSVASVFIMILLGSEITDHMLAATTNRLEQLAHENFYTTMTATCQI
jgi:hypothetical protein